MEPLPETDIVPAPGRTEYQYEALHPASQSVRLFVLEPGEFGTSVSGSLLIMSLDELQQSKKIRNPKWFALSYVWGSGERDRFIQIEGQSLRTTKTLIEALQYLRDAQKQTLWWIDQICINQDDIDERNAQVAVMHDIYSDTCVVAWLGLSDRLRKSVMFVSLAGTFTQGYPKTETGWSAQVVEGISKALNLSSGGKNHLESIMKRVLVCICESPWFERLWTFQEAVLCSQLSLHAGGSSLEWPLLEKYLYMMLPGIKNLEIVGALEKSTWGPILSVKSARRIVKGGIKEIGDQRVQEIFAFGSQAMVRKCKDDRDYVYAQIGLFDHRTRARLKPDYGLSVCEVFIQGSLAILAVQEDLALLEESCAICTQGTYDLPSWCKHWSSRPLACDMSGQRALWNAEHLYTTSFGTDHRSIVRPAGTAYLDVKGFVLDEIEQECIDTSEVNAWDCFIRLWSYINTGCTSLSQREDFYQTFISGLSYQKEVDIVHQWFQTIAEKQELPRNPPGLATTFDEKMAMNLHWTISLKATSMFKTQNNYHVKACSKVRPGDQICFLYGGCLPFILRKVGRSTAGKSSEESSDTVEHQLIGGSCYVRGLIGDECLKFSEKNGIRSRTFRIV